MHLKVLSRFLFGPRYKRDGSDPTDLAIINAKVVTSDPENPRAKAVAVKGGLIAYVGGDRGIADHIGPDTRIIDARGRILTPGFVDNHCHLLWVGALRPLMTTALYECNSLEEVSSCVTDYATEQSDMPFVMCMGFRYDYIPGGEPTKEMLDEIVDDRPVILWSHGAHSGWLNTPALELMEKRNPTAFHRMTPMVDPETGEYTGMLFHFWFINPLEFFSWDELPPQTREKMLQGMEEILDEALAVGVTTIDDVMIHKPFVPMVLEFRDRGGFERSRARATYYINHYALEDEEGFKANLRWWRELGEKESDSRLILGSSVKLGIEGIFENHTALLLEPYSDRPSFFGEATWSQEDFDRLVEIIDTMGIQCCTHAIGDGGIRMVVNTYEKTLNRNGKRPYPLRVDHNELPDPAEIERMGRLGIHAAMQPAHFFGDESREKALGPQRLKRVMPWKSLEDTGVELSFGSDACAGPINPVYGLLISATRLNYKLDTDWGREERISLEDGIRHWTLDSAKALALEDKIGSIEVGKYADLVLFNTNPLKLDSWWFLLTHKLELGAMDDFVDMTMVGGEVVYRKDGARL